MMQMSKDFVSISIKKSTKKKIENVQAFSGFKSLSETVNYAVDFYQYHLLKSLSDKRVSELVGDAIKVAKIMSSELDTPEKMSRLLEMINKGEKQNE